MAHQFAFSIIMSVYNVAEYINEAVESIIQQSLDFETNVQIIFVDDCSTDNSGQICDSFQKRYPQNIKVVHKSKNEGLALSRLTGLSLADGRYISFFDPDDLLSKETLENVLRFFVENSSAVDVVSIPLFFFGDKQGPHPLNTKFEKGSRIIDLHQEYTSTQMSMASAFFTRDAMKNLSADADLVTAEDAKELAKILTDKFTLGVVCEACYHYRKRGTSSVGQAQAKKNWYLTYLTHYSEWAIQYCKSKLGYVPRFIQYTILYDLQWKYLPQKIPAGILTEAEKALYQEKLFKIAQYFDDDIIFSQRSIFLDHKLYLMYRKYQKSPQIFSSLSSHDVCICFEGSNSVFPLNALAVYIYRIVINQGIVSVEGAVVCPEIGLSTPEIYLMLGDSKIPTAPLRYKDVVYSAEVPIGRRAGFCATFPAPAEKTLVRVVAQYGEADVLQQRVYFGKYAPVTKQFPCSFYYKDNLMVTPGANGFYIFPAKGKSVVKKELLFDLSLLKQKKMETTKAVFARLLYYVLRAILPKDIWLVMDKSNRADDNGEAFFTYLCQNKDIVKCHPVFAVGKDSPDYKRIQKIGPVIPYMSWRHKMLHLLAAHTISAYSHDEISSPFLGYSMYYGDLLQKNQVVFLQHGIIKDDLSVSLNRKHKNYSMFVVSTQKEWVSVVDNNYGYDKDQIVLTGLPRYDFLYNAPQKKITLMPTWQRKLVGEYNAIHSQWTLLPGFTDSAYYKFYNGLITSPKLLDAAAQYGYKIQLLVHPVFLPYADYFKPDPRATVLTENVCYRDIFAESSLVTTDYSSAVFDFAYLRKPIIYTQFEENHYEKGYFDYERDGLGEIEHDLESTIDRIIEYMQNGCQLKEKYRKRIDQFFAFHDRNNCQRVYEKIMELEEGQ